MIIAKFTRNNSQTISGQVQPKSEILSLNFISAKIRLLESVAARHSRVKVRTYHLNLPIWSSLTCENLSHAFNFWYPLISTFDPDMNISFFILQGSLIYYNVHFKDSKEEY